MLLHEVEYDFVLEIYAKCTKFNKGFGGLFTLGDDRGDFSVRKCMYPVRLRRYHWHQPYDSHRSNRAHIKPENINGSCLSDSGGSLSAAAGKLLAFVGALEVSVIVAVCDRR